MSHSTLKKLVYEQKATIIFVYGTARSGSTITQVIFANLADIAIHEPFTGLLQNQVTHSGVNKFEFDQEIYQAGCDLIANKIFQIIKYKNHATVLIKEVSSFFETGIWEKWSQIPEKFLFTIRDPHLQYFSRLSQITNLSNPHGLSSSSFDVIEKSTITESLELSTLKPFFSGTVIDNNKESWQKLNSHQNQVRTAIIGTDKTMAILDATLLKKDPKYTIEQTIKQLGFQIKEPDDFEKNLQIKSQEKVFDVRDPNRYTVRKARNSKEIDPLVPGENISPYDFPPSSREHIWQIISFYLDLLYAPEQVAMPSLTQLDTPVSQSDTWKLDDINPFVAYAITSFHLHQKTASPEKFFPLIKRILNGRIKTATGSEKNINSIDFRDSFDRVDSYWSYHKNSIL